MAYPTVSKPYGLQPVNLIGGQVFAGATRQLAITTSSVSYNTALYNGDVVLAWVCFWRYRCVCLHR